jgi:hypothetical protein
MQPADREALAQLEAELQKMPAGVGGPLALRVPWLIRIVKELDTRVLELEAGGIPDVIAAKDALIAERDASMAKTAERLAKLEADKLPDPREYFRSTEPADKVNDDAVSRSSDVAKTDRTTKTDT